MATEEPTTTIPDASNSDPATQRPAEATGTTRSILRQIEYAPPHD